MIKLIVSIVLAIAAFFLYKKTNTAPAEPESDNPVFFICLVPVLLLWIIERGETDLTLPFGAFLERALYAIFTAIWMQFLIVGAGIRFFKSPSEDKITYSELFPIIAGFTMANIIDGFGLNLLFALGLGLISVGLFLKTRSLDLSLSLHLLFAAVKVYADSFVISPYLDSSTYKLLILSHCILLIIFGVWILQDNILSISAEEGKFNG